MSKLSMTNCKGTSPKLEPEITTHEHNKYKITRKLSAIQIRAHRSCEQDTKVSLIHKHIFNNVKRVISFY